MLSTVTFAGVTFLLFCTFGKPVYASVSVILFFFLARCNVQDSMLSFGLSFISSFSKKKKKNFTKYVHHFSETHPKLNKSLHFPNWIPWIVFLKRRLHTLWMRLLPFCIANLYRSLFSPNPSKQNFDKLAPFPLRQKKWKPRLWSTLGRPEKNKNRA